MSISEDKIQELVTLQNEEDTRKAGSFDNISTYQWQQMVLKLAKPGRDILNSLSPAKVDMLHAAVGIAGEAGELLDAVKKAVIYNKELDVENLIEELGDLEFYMEQLRCNVLVLTTREHCLKKNYKKLNKRYAKGYSDKAAHERADKVEDQVHDQIFKRDKQAKESAEEPTPAQRAEAYKEASKHQYSIPPTVEKQEEPSAFADELRNADLITVINLVTLQYTDIPTKQLAIQELHRRGYSSIEQAQADANSFNQTGE